MSTTATAKDESPQQVHRLLGMRVNEVSAVDRAANKRVFLVIKREGGKMKIVKGADGRQRVEKDDNAAQPQLPGNGAPAADKLAPMQAQVKDSLLQALSAAAEELVTLANQVKDAEVTEQAATPPVPQSVTAQLTELSSTLSGLAAQYGGTGEQPNKAAGAKPDEQPAAPAAGDATPGTAAAPAKADLEGVSANGGPDEQGEQKRDYAAVGKALAVAKRLAPANGATSVVIKGVDLDVFKAAFSVVTKVGRKMAKERLGRFRKAMDILAGLMKELSAETTRKAAGDPAPKRRSGLVELTVAEAHEMQTALVTAGRRIDELATVNKAQTDTIRAYKNGTPPPNSGPQGERAPAASSSQVRWPMDMNAPQRT